MYKWKSLNRPQIIQFLINMGRIDVILPDDLEQKFRKKVFEKYGMKRGNITKTIQEAIENWIEIN